MEQIETRNYRVVGVTFEGRQERLSEFYRNYRVGHQYGVNLVPEDANPYDANAVAVHLEVLPGHYEMVGYLSGKNSDNVVARELMPKMRSASLGTIGPTRKGDIGLNITVTYDK